MTGIYKITSPSNRVYIGQSVNIEKRFYRYKILSSNIQLQTILYRSFLKYGVDKHKFDVICECDEHELNDKERFYQEIYNCLDHGLNCVLTKPSDRSGRVSKETAKRMSLSQKGNNHWLGKKHTEATKEKIRQKAIGRRFSKEVNMSKGRKGRPVNRPYANSKDHARSVTIDQFDREMNFIKRWECMNDINRELGYHIGNVSSCINGNLKTYKGFIWKRV